MKKIIIGIIIGVIISGTVGVVASTIISSTNVTYQNKTVNTALDELYNEAATGKELIAAAITNKGITTTSTDTYETMAANINNIATDYTEKTYNPDNISYHSCKKIADYSSTGEISIAIQFKFLSNVSVGAVILKGFPPPKRETEGVIIGGYNEVYKIAINTDGDIYLKTGANAGYYSSGYTWMVHIAYDTV